MFHRSARQTEKLAQDFTLDLLMKSPKMSIDQVARVVSYKFHGHGIPKSSIAKLRTSIRLLLAPTPLPPKDTNLETHTLPTSTYHVQEAQVDALQKHLEKVVSTRDERAAYLNEWALANPLKTIEEAREALREHFGMTMGTKYIADTMKVAREIHLAQINPPLLQPQQVTIPEVEPLRDPRALAVFAATLRMAKIKRFEIHEDGTYNVEFLG